LHAALLVTIGADSARAIVFLSRHIMTLKHTSRSITTGSIFQAKSPSTRYLYTKIMQEIDNSPLLENLNILQKKAKYSNRKVSELTKGGVSDRHIANIKNNNNSPSFEVIKVLADVFDIKPWQLLLPNVKKEPDTTYDKDLSKIRFHRLNRGLVRVVLEALSHCLLSNYVPRYLPEKGSTYPPT